MIKALLLASLFTLVGSFVVMVVSLLYVSRMEKKEEQKWRAEHFWKIHDSADWDKIKKGDGDE